MKRCQVTIVKGAGHNLMTNPKVVVEAMDWICDAWGESHCPYWTNTVLTLIQTVIEETLIVLPHASQSANLCFCWINPASSRPHCFHVHYFASWPSHMGCLPRRSLTVIVSAPRSRISHVLIHMSMFTLCISHFLAGSSLVRRPTPSIPVDSIAHPFASHSSFFPLTLTLALPCHTHCICHLHPKLDLHRTDCYECLWIMAVSRD